MSEAARKDSDVELMLEFDRRLRDLERNTLNASKSAQRWHAPGDLSDPLAAPFGTNIANVGGIWAPFAYYKDGTGMVHLRGAVKQNAVGLGNVVCILPVGFRPTLPVGALFEQFTVQAYESVVPVNTIATVNIGTDGAIGLGNPPGAGGKWDIFPLFNMHFYAG